MSKSCVPAQLLAPETQEYEADVRFFLQWGYLVLEHRLTEAELETIRAAFDETYRRHQSNFVHSLLEADDRFDLLLEYPPVIRRIRALLGSCIQLHSATLRNSPPGEPDQGWHRDGPWPLAPWQPPYGGIPSQINCGFFLDETTDLNGPTVVLPGSHRAPFRPPVGHVEFPDEKRLYAKAGQIALFDSWTFHRGSVNRSELPRRVVLFAYQHAWMKSREKFDGPKVAKLRETGSPERKLLLGEVERW